MNLTIISGGTGNDALVRGLKSLYPKLNIKVVVNAYDAGKSTGICRKVTDTLGVSDIRKNHIRMYQATCGTPNKSIVEFYNNRYDFTKGNELEEILVLLEDWGLSMFSGFVRHFFQREESGKYRYKDFNVSNIVYAEMYSEIGYAETNRIFCNLLNIEDFLVLNSFDNVYINAITESGNRIEDEGEIVEYCNAQDYIHHLEYKGDCDKSINPDASKAILEADFIVVSTGTFWSSIYPTLDYGNFFEIVNQSSAKKLWIMNNECDKDAYGVGSNMIIDILNQLGLNIDDFMFLLNEDATPLMKQKNDSIKSCVVPMGNVAGKHNSTECAKQVLSYYYGIQGIKFDRILFDFDDTLWSRSYSEVGEDKVVSRNNVMTVYSHFKDIATVISGNSYSSIRKKLASVFGSEAEKFCVPVWADANSTCYRYGDKVGSIKEFNLPLEKIELLREFLVANYNIVPIMDVYHNCLDTSLVTTYVKIKPLEPTFRKVLLNYLNKWVLPHIGFHEAKAVSTGKSTIDILHKSNCKSKVIDYCDFKETDRTLYIGDECNEGNDKDIASKCTVYINTKDVHETACILELLK